MVEWLSSDSREYRFPSIVLPPLPRFPESFARTIPSKKRSRDNMKVHELLSPSPPALPRQMSISELTENMGIEDRRYSSHSSELPYHRRSSPKQPPSLNSILNSNLETEREYGGYSSDESSERSPSPETEPVVSTRMSPTTVYNNTPRPHQILPSSGHLRDMMTRSDSTPSSSTRPQHLNVPSSISIHEIIPGSTSSSKSTKPTKRKKVKYHECDVCHKLFPRPSGLRTHMNIHNNEKPFACSFPGCNKRFSVVSNAKRHERTHGVGLSAADEPPSLPYVIDFSAPVVPPVPPNLISKEQPLNLRWMPPGVETRRGPGGGRFHQKSDSPSTSSSSDNSPPLESSSGASGSSSPLDGIAIFPSPSRPWPSQLHHDMVGSLQATPTVAST